MADLKDIMKIKGVVAVGRFSDEGHLLEYEGDMQEDEAAMAAQMCAANKMMGQMQVNGFTAMSGEDGWTPLAGFALSGPSMSVCVEGDIGVFVKNDEVSFNEVFQALRG
jgi:roadblock/LC7 domain-containing protein